MRLAELKDAGVTAATVSRMEKDGEVVRLARGVYQLPDAELDKNHSLAEEYGGLRLRASVGPWTGWPQAPRRRCGKGSSSGSRRGTAS